MYSTVVVQKVLQRRQETSRWGVQWLATGSWQRKLKTIIKADPLTTTWEVAKELNVNHSTVILHLKQIGKVKKFDKWVSHELTRNQKRCSEVSSSFYSTQQRTISQSDWDKKWILYNWQWLAQWVDKEEGPKHFPKPNLHQKKVMLTVCCSAADLIHYSWLNPSETITSETYAQQIDEMHRKLQHLQLTFVNRKDPTTPDCTLCNQHFKSWTNWGWSFASSTILTWTVSNWLPLLQASQQRFAGKTLPHQQDAENAFQEFTESQSTDFSLYGNKQIISHGDKCTDCNSSYFDE